MLWVRLLSVRLPRFENGLLDALSQMPFQPDPFLLPGLGLAFFTGLSVFYFETAYWHATAGQRLLGLSVVRPDGEPVGWARALVRTLALGISMLYLFLGVLWIGFDRLRQGWHDKVAGTYVVHACGPRSSLLALVRRTVGPKNA